MKRIDRSTGEATAIRCARAFLLIGLPALILLCFLVPPFHGSDETAHFLRVLSVGRGEMLPQVMQHDPSQNGGPSAGGTVDAAAADFALHWSWHPDHHYAVEDVTALGEAHASGAGAYAHHSNTAIYPALTYLPASLAADLAMAAGLPILDWFYAARLAGAFVAAAILFWAIRRSGDAALAFLIAATLPVTLFQGAVLTTDAMMLPSLLLFGAMLRRIAIAAPMRPIDHAATVATMLVIALAKVAYLPIVAMPACAALIADRGLSSRARGYAAAAIVAGVLWLGWAWIVHDKIFPLYAGAAVDTPAQVAFMLHNPGDTLAALVRTMARDLPSMTFGLTGSRLGLNDLMLAKPFIIVALAVLIASAVPAARGVRISPAILAIGLAIAAICYVAIYLLLYLQFNGVGSPYVEGVQSRYLTPLAFMLLAITPRRSVGDRAMTRLVPLAIGWAAVTALFTLVGTTLNYWTF